MNSLKKNVIVVLSINERPFNSITLNNIKSYSEKIGSDFIIVNKVKLDFWTNLCSSLFKFKRKGIKSYIQKMLSIYDCLNDYEKVLLLDDTCLVSAEAPNLFDLVPPQYIAAYPESEHVEFKSFYSDKEFIREKRGLTIEKYFNTGVLLVDRHNQSVFSPDNIFKNLDLFRGKYPDQGFFNYFANQDMKMFSLAEKWNFMPVIDYQDDKNRELKRLPDDYLETVEKQHIIHVTGFFKYRTNIIQSLNDFLSK